MDQLPERKIFTPNNSSTNSNNSNSNNKNSGGKGDHSIYSNQSNNKDESNNNNHNNHNHNHNHSHSNSGNESGLESEDEISAKIRRRDFVVDVTPSQPPSFTTVRFTHRNCWLIVQDYRGIYLNRSISIV